MTHNLYDLQRPGARCGGLRGRVCPLDRQAVARADVDALLDYRRLAPHAERAHPTQEHFLPLLVALGARPRV